MRIQESQVKKMLITEVLGLDPVSVFLEDFAPGVGKITIECFGKSWSSRWPAMGTDIADFVCGCDNHYLAKNLWPGLAHDVLDEDNVSRAIRPIVIQRRREGAIDKDEARKRGKSKRGSR